MATPTSLARMQVDLVANTEPFSRDMRRAEATLGRFSTEAGRFFARYESGAQRVIDVNNLSTATLEQVGATSAATFSRIQQDINLASQDFARGVISVQDYNAALEMARHEAEQLRATGVKPMGDELSAFNSIMRDTGGQAAQGARSFGILRRSMGSLAARAVGLNGTIGTVLSSLSGFALPALTTAGIFAGVAAIGLAFKGVRDDAKEAAEQIKAFISEFDPFQKLLERFQTREAVQAQIDVIQAERDRITDGALPIGAPGVVVAAHRAIRGPGRVQEIDELLQSLERAREGFEDSFATNSEAAREHAESLARLTPPVTSGLDRMVASLTVAVPAIDDHAERLRRATEGLALPGAALPDRMRMLVQRDQFPEMQFSGAAGGALDLQPQRLDIVNFKIAEAARAMEKVGDEGNRAAEVAIAGFGGVVAAFAAGAANMQQTAISAFTNIAQALSGGGVLGAVVGAVGGIIGGLFARNNRPTPVRVEDYSAMAERKMKDANPEPVIRVVFDFPDGTREPTDEELRQLGLGLARLRRKGATV